MTHASISQIINEGRQPGLKVCEGIASAFGMPTEMIMRMVGILPELPQEHQDEETILALFRELPDDGTRATIINAMRGIVEARKVATKDQK